jgi:4a-hydroxytetrahydrobiopterin dehydratase
MDDQRALTGREANTATESIGWRLLLGALHAAVPVGSYEQALRVAAAAVRACGDDADHLRVDLRADRVELRLQDPRLAAVTAQDAALAGQITAAVRTEGGVTGGSTTAELARPVQSLEIGIDALDIPAIRPFWKAVLGYAAEPGRDKPDDALVDPTGQGAAIWFQQMDAPRPQRNRVHLDITVAHDEADARVAAALAAGGRLLTDSYARSFWVLADAEGNEVCVCTWQDRDERD